MGFDSEGEKEDFSGSAHFTGVAGDDPLEPDGAGLMRFIALRMRERKAQLKNKPI
jgi:hypothetical protein